MRTRHSAMTGRGPTEEVESSWLGAEALPGGTISVDTDESDSPGLATAPAPDRGRAAWIAAVLSWARRKRST
jgi:hypothetical protein